MTSQARSSDGLEDRFLFVGNYLCLDFVNTKLVLAGQPVDLLRDFGSLVQWLVQAQVLDNQKGKELLRQWQGGAEAETLFEQAVAFRASLHEMAGRIINSGPVPQSTVIQINGWLRNPIGHAELKRAGSGFEKRFQADFQQPSHLLWPVAESACDLLCYGDLQLVKKCENETCVLFFYDTTRNHSRRWCSMSACGNRMKVAAHYRRLRKRGRNASPGAWG